MQHYMRIILFVFTVTAMATSTFFSMCWAKPYDALLCFEATRKIEAEYNLPPHILSAIALTESGKQNVYYKKKIQSPWPWTANVRGKGKFFASKTAALRTFEKLIENNDDMFDVGCMQINWHYHKQAFSSIEEALTPYYNVQYAAEFLTSLYEKTGSWPKAVERYHSSTPVHYKRYRKVVASNWLKARDLVSPIDGHLNSLLIQPKLRDIKNVNAVRADNQKIENSLKVARMREIAKLRARVRQYANNSY